MNEGSMTCGAMLCVMVIDLENWGNTCAWEGEREREPM